MQTILKQFTQENPVAKQVNTHSKAPVVQSASYGLLQAQLQKRILILDGAMGTMIQAYKFEEQDYRGEQFSDWHCDVKGNNDMLVLT